MAKYDIKRTNLYYTVGDNTCVNANDIFSFRADVESIPTEHWYGFYDSRSEKYLIFPSGIDETCCLELNPIEDELLSDFENRLQELIYNYNNDFIKIVKVADDQSLMNEMEWI